MRCCWWSLPDVSSMPSTEPQFSHRRLWLLVGWVLVAAVIYVSLTPKPPDVGIRINDKFSHLAAYAVLMGWFCQLYWQRGARLRNGLLLVAMGIALEIAQGLGQHRMFEYADMLANTLGVLAGWALARGPLSRLLLRFEAMLPAHN
ncbi:MAG: VanZ family protein [Pseudomonadota bacterium]|nr:MAG: VanZ family protein [Pseudomonadota bacterium]